MTPDKFNIRVYGLIIKDQKVLLVKEEIKDFAFVKFPGGGVEKGEGILDALRRELREELQVRATVIQHFYTTDFFQVSAFNPSEQIISVYYRVLLESYPEEGFVHIESGHKMEFTWCPVESLNSEHVTFPIDKHVVELILKPGFGIENDETY